MIPRSCWFIAAVAFYLSCGETHPPAERAFRNGSIYTVDRERSSAQALAISRGRLVYVGSNQGLAAFVGPKTEVIDLGGRMVLPGFVDSHSHPLSAVTQATSVYLYNLRSLDGYLKTVAEFAAKHPEKAVIRGAGWSNTLFPPVGPLKKDLDRVVSERPVFLTSEDGHSAWVNSKTLQIAGITGGTANPQGGVIERDAKTKEPAGTLRENAVGLASRAIPPNTEEELVEGLRLFQKMAGESGVTTVHDAAVGLEGWSAEPYEKLQASGELSVRFRGALLLTPEMGAEKIPALVQERARHRGELFQTNAVKIFADGVVEGGTAYLLEPYQHRPDFRGVPIWDAEVMKKAFAALDKEGFQIHIHAIGDAATRMALDALDHARRANGSRDWRPLITHLQLVAAADLPRFKALGVVAVPQPFWHQKGNYYLRLEVPYLGRERADREYPLQSFIKAGVVLASASDYSVTYPFLPLIGIERGVTRIENGRTEPGEVLGPEERASLADMIASFTIGGAYANFLESEVGSLEVGKSADLVVLDKNLFELPPEKIDEARVMLTVFRGKDVYGHLQ